MTEYEVERMVVKLVGDQTSYNQMIADAEARSVAAAQRVDAQTQKVSAAQRRAMEQSAKAAQEQAEQIDKTKMSWAELGETALTIAGFFSKFAGVLGIALTVAKDMYQVLFNWSELPLWKKMLPVMWAYKALLEALYAPINLVIKSTQLLYTTVTSIPTAIEKVLSLLPTLAVTAANAVKYAVEKTWSSLQWLGSKAGSALGSAAGFAAGLPGRAFDAAQSGLGTAGSMLRTGGLVLGGAGAAIAGPMGKAGADFGSYGKQIGQVAQSQDLAAERASALALASERTGISIEKLVKLLPKTSEEYAKWNKEAQALGLTLDKQGVKSAEALADSYLRVKEAAKGVWMQIGAAAAPALKEWNDVVVGVSKAAIKWISDHKELIATIFKFASAAVAAGSALVTLGTALGTISTFLGPIIAALTAGAAAWLAWDTAMGKSLRDSATGLWDNYKAGVMSAYETTVTYGKQIYEFWDKTLQGIYNAIKQGNLKQAVEIAWGAAKVSWIAALTEIDKWTGERFSAILQNLAAGRWEDAATAAMNAVKIAWYQGQMFLQEIWTKIANYADVQFFKIETQGRLLFKQLVDAVDPFYVRTSLAISKVVQEFIEMKDAVTVIFQMLTPMFTTFGMKYASVFIAPLRAIPGIGKAAKEAFADIMTAVKGGAMDPTKMMMDPTIMAGPAARALSKTMRDRLFGTEEQKAAAEAGAAAGKIKEEAEWKAIVDARKNQRNADFVIDFTERKTAVEQRIRERNAALATEQERIQAKLNELAQKQAELLEKGKKEAAAKLETEKEALRIEQNRAEIEQKYQESQAPANAAALKDIAEAQEKFAKAKEEADKLMDKFEPMRAYLENLKMLDKQLKDGLITQDVFNKAVKQAKREFDQAQFKVEVQFGIRGMDAVRAGTKEYQDLVANTLETIATQKKLNDPMRNAWMNEQRRIAGMTDAEKEKEFEAVWGAKEVETQRRNLEETIQTDGATNILDDMLRNGDRFGKEREANTTWVPSEREFERNKLEAGLRSNAMDDMLKIMERVAVAVEKTADEPKVEFDVTEAELE